MANGTEAADAFRPLGRHVTSGSAADFHGTEAVALTEREAAQRGRKVGDALTVQLGDKTFHARIVAVFAQVDGASGAVTVPLEMLTAAGLPEQDQMLIVHPRDGASADAVRARLDALVAENPAVTVSDANAYKDMITAQLDQVLHLLYGLLALAVVIAVLGIVNTLALSVVERTREIGLLRAIGLSRGQLRRMIRLESVVIALLGAALGLGLGLYAGFGVTTLLESEGLTAQVVPWGTVLTLLVAAVLVGILAALWPAWRASRRPVLTAIATD